jgi:methylenetetrahydrofolate--tRNA-(uracil-5-)-methyltransferase
LASGLEALTLPPETTLGSMAHYITTADFRHFQPMNANFGLYPPLGQRVRSKKEKNESIADRALRGIDAFARDLRSTENVPSV